MKEPGAPFVHLHGQLPRSSRDVRWLMSYFCRDCYWQRWKAAQGCSRRRLARRKSEPSQAQTVSTCSRKLTRSPQAPDGFYDAQSPDKPEHHCRGRFETDSNGNYSLVALKPTPYPIPFDFSAGKLLNMMDRHPYRPAHIHFHVQAPGHKTLVTQVFSRDSQYLDDDAVFAVKDSLIVDFVAPTSPLPKGGEFDEEIKSVPVLPRSCGPPADHPSPRCARYELKYDICLAGDGEVDNSAYQG